MREVDPDDDVADYELALRARRRRALLIIGAVLAIAAAFSRFAVRSTRPPRVPVHAHSRSHVLPGDRTHGARVISMSEDTARPREGSVVEHRTQPLAPWWLDVIDVSAEPAGSEVRTNQEPIDGGGSRFDPRELAVLQEIIDTHELSEASSAFDYDDGDGVFEPWELGHQVWIGSHLVSLTTGPDRHESFGYGLVELPASISELDRLQYLGVHDNQLSALPEGLAALTGLSRLDAYGNRLSALPEKLDTLSDLQALSIGANQLESLPPSLARLPRLTELYARDNPLMEVPPALLASRSLRVLDVSRSPGGPANGLTSLPDEVAHTALTSLDVTGNRLGCGGAPLAGFFVDTGSIQIYGLAAQRCDAAPFGN